MTLRGRGTQILLNRFGRARLLQSLALPTAPGDLVFLGDALSIQGAWDEWFPGSPVRILGDEAFLIDDARKLIATIDSPKALILTLGTADLLGLAGSTSPAHAAFRLDALLGLATARINPATIFVVGVPPRRALGDRSEKFNETVETIASARGVTFVPPPHRTGDQADGYLAALLRWDATVYSDLARDLSRALGVARAAGRPVLPLVDVGKKLVQRGQRKREQLFEALPVPSGRVVLYGDSITEGGSWDGWLPGLAVANRGIGGDTIAELAARIDTAIESPRAVSVLAGTNDLDRGEPKDPESIAHRFHDLIGLIRTRDANVPILINSVMPRSTRFADSLTTINSRYRDIATEFGATYLDLWPVLAAHDRSMRSELTPDGVHLNADGYREWSNLLRPTLEGIIRT